MFDSLSDRFEGIFTRLRSRGRLGEKEVDEVCREIRIALLEADVNFKVVKGFVARVKEQAAGADLSKSLSPAQQVIKIVNQELVNTLGGTTGKLVMNPKPPTVVMLVGLQGSGKTTACGKLARHLKSQGLQTRLVAVGIEGVILTKIDGDARGGAALSVKEVTGRPILFAGTGEKLADFEPFHPDRMASRILGMGDVLTLIEKAEATFDQEEAVKAAGKLRQGNFTLEDFLEQMQQVRKLGPIQNIIGMLPGLPKELKGAQ